MHTKRTIGVRGLEFEKKSLLFVEDSKILYNLLFNLIYFKCKKLIA